MLVPSSPLAGPAGWGVGGLSGGVALRGGRGGCGVPVLLLPANVTINRKGTVLAELGTEMAHEHTASGARALLVRAAPWDAWDAWDVLSTPVWLHVSTSLASRQRQPTMHVPE